MSDFYGVATRLLTDSQVMHVRPGTAVQLYTAGTSTLIWSGTADANGVYIVPTLATGQYDVKVDGVLVHSFHHVKADHVHTADQEHQFFVSGAITADQDEVITLPAFAPGVAGDIIAIRITARTDATGDLTVHLLRGSTTGTTALTVASNSVWSKQVAPAAVRYRWADLDANPGVTLTATQALALGIDWTANAVSGLCVTVVFRPT